jgi:AcrR family transcriptional regulator
MARTAGSHSDITGPRIRQAAQSLFARHGFAAVSMRQIAAEVGVQVGALYNYTPDKQSLLFELMRSHMEEVLAAYNDLPDVEPNARLRQFVSFHIRFHFDRPDAVFIAYMELRNLSPEKFAEVETLRKMYETHLEKIIRDGKATQGFQVAEPKVTTRAIIAMLTGVNTWFRADGRLSLDDVEQVYWKMVSGAVGAPAR